MNGFVCFRVLTVSCGNVLQRRNGNLYLSEPSWCLFDLLNERRRKREREKWSWRDQIKNYADKCQLCIKSFWLNCSPNPNSTWSHCYTLKHFSMYFKINNNTQQQQQNDLCSFDAYLYSVRHVEFFDKPLG